MITIFGASVTQQKDGYAEKLSIKLNEKVEIYGFGGMHLNNAGICYIDKVIKDNPSYCFIDWFSTGFITCTDETKEYIDTIVYKFSKINCKLIFLFLPHREINERNDFYNFCKNYLDSKKLYSINVYDNIGSLDAVLRDDVHTTSYGSDLYADIIYKRFIEIKKLLIIPHEVSVTKYVNIQKIIVNKIFNKTIEISGNCEIIGFLLTIGPHSGIIEIIGSDNTNKFMKYNTWDRWCHYYRKHFNLPHIEEPIKVSQKIKLNILQEHFDTNLYKGDMNFNEISKYLIVHDIYFIGKQLQINNLKEGKKIPNNYLKKIQKKLYMLIKKLFRD